jgi:hypothetical protein
MKDLSEKAKDFLKDGDLDKLSDDERKRVKPKDVLEIAVSVKNIFRQWCFRFLSKLPLSSFVATNTPLKCNCKRFHFQKDKLKGAGRDKLKNLTKIIGRGGKEDVRNFTSKLNCSQLREVLNEVIILI